MKPAHISAFLPEVIVPKRCRRLLVAAQKEGLKVVNFDRNKDLEELLQGVSKETRQAMFESGISGVLLFGIPAHKDELGSQAYAPDGITQRAVRKIKKDYPQIPAYEEYDELLAAIRAAMAQD